MEIKIHALNTTEVESSENILMDGNFRAMISLWFTHDDSSELWTKDWSDSTGSDRPISANAIQVDGNIIHVASWAGGYGVYRMEDDGNLTLLYNNYKPINDYAYYNSICIDKVRKIAYVGSYGSSGGLARFDYSDPGNVVQLATWTKENSDLKGDEFGLHYVNGLGIAGDYVYYMTEDYSAYAAERWHSGTGVFDSVDIQNDAGQFNKRGAVYYSEDTDRIFLHSYYDGELDIVCNASQADAKAYSILYDDLPGIDNDGYIHLCCEDRNNPNHLWVGSGYQIFKIDITPCIVDGVAENTKPILISTKVLHREADCGTYSNMRFSWHTEHKGDFITLMGDRGWNRQGGWLDQENENVVSCSRYNSAAMHRSRDYLCYDYGCHPLLITTAGGAKYWLFGGYGWDGYRFKIFNESQAYKLSVNGHVEFKTTQLDNSKNIGSVHLPQLDTEFFIPSGCSANIFISNNGGSTWETYGRTGTHFFTSKGNFFKLKIYFYGTGIASPYFLSKRELQVYLVEENPYVSMNPKSTVYRLNGGG